MIVAIDTLFMLKKFRCTGTGVYLKNVLSECLRLAGTANPNMEFHAFVLPNDNWATNGFSSSRLKVHESPMLAWRRVWLLGGMALQMSRLGPDLVFLPTAHHSLPGNCAPTVTTILDTMPKRLPSNHFHHATALHAMTWLNARLATKIVTISEWSKKDLVELYHLDPQKVEVTYLAHDRLLYNPEPPSAQASVALLSRLGIRQPFVLHHGMVQRRKNVHSLIQAWDRLLRANKSFDSQLVLAGPMGVGYQEVFEARQASPNRERIVVTGPLPQTDLALLVKSAYLCVIPSLYEGFCLPMLEAMACGIPTVASNRSCIPEISGGVLKYFNPESIEEMAETIRLALEDTSLREYLRRQGLARATEFSWQRCARETMRIFAAAGKEHA